MKRTARLAILCLLICAFLAQTLVLSACSEEKKEIVIYTSAEDFRIAYMQERMAEKFPDYKVVFEYKSSGDHAAYLKSAGTDAECDISHDIEYSYAAELSSAGVFADISSMVSFDVYTADAILNDYVAPELRNGGAIILNMDVITEKGLDIPTSYRDLLHPQYKDLISMPNPNASGTGYMFYLNLVNAWGEEHAMQYFNDLSENVLAFTSSGSGPVNALVGKEVAIGFGMTAQATLKITEGENLRIVFFEEGSPFSMYGQAIIAGKESDPAVVEVFDFLANELTEEMCESFYPEKIFKDKDFAVENFPVGIVYGDMRDNTPTRKANLLTKWTH